MSYTSDIRLDKAKEKYNLKLGSEVSILQVEAGMPYSPSPALKLSYPFVPTPPTVGASGHANIVLDAIRELLPNLSSISVAYAPNYRSRGLKTGMFVAPPVWPWQVENHSYVGDAAAFNANAINLLDYRINRDGTTVVVALENGTGSMKALWGNAWNTICVGSTNGQHTQGGTRLIGTGRNKPDVVGTATYTSYATPVVSSLAAIICEQYKGKYGVWPDAKIVKAIIMAGASKKEFPLWSNTETSPLDPVYGAGEVDALNSLSILEQGYVLPYLSSFNTEFEITQDGEDDEFSAIVVWNREPKPDSNWWAFSNPLPTVSMRLLKDGVVIARSTPSVDNVAHIYTKDLAVGKYTLEVINPNSIGVVLAYRFPEQVAVVPPVAPPPARVYTPIKISNMPYWVCCITGDTKTIAPNIEADDDAVFEWSIDGKVVSSSRSFVWAPEIEKDSNLALTAYYPEDPSGARYAAGCFIEARNLRATRPMVDVTGHYLVSVSDEGFDERLVQIEHEGKLFVEQE